jgi:hypothetical protein
MMSCIDKISAGNSRAAYMRVQRKQLEEDTCNNVPNQTKLNAGQQREYTETHKNLSAEF